MFRRLDGWMVKHVPMWWAMPPLWLGLLIDVVRFAARRPDAFDAPDYWCGPCRRYHSPDLHAAVALGRKDERP